MFTAMVAETTSPSDEKKSVTRQEKPEKPKKPTKAPLVLPAAGSLPLPRGLAFAGATLSGLLYFVSFAGMDVWPLSFVAFVPLWVALHRQAPRRALLLGLVTGLTMNVCGFYWLQNMLLKFSGFPAAVCAIFVVIICAYQGGRLALMGWLYARTSARGWPAAGMLILAFAASELLYPLLFPWYYAATVHQMPALTQVAELGGPILVGVMLLGVNIALAEPILARLEKRKILWPRVAGGLAGLLVSIAFGAWRISAVDARAAASDKAVVGVVQGNLELLQKREDPAEGLRRHKRMSRELKAKGAEFVVWSESSVTIPVPEEMGDRLIHDRVTRDLGMPAIVGAVYWRVDPDRERWFNTALSTDLAGKVNGRFDKTYLLMFGEYLPFGDTFPILYKWSPHSGRFSAGTKLDPLYIDQNGTKRVVSTLICYEDILPSFTNKLVRHANPELLVNITNDAWFGDTTEPWEHLALAKFRSIEHRRFLVRSTNSGVSAIIDPVGRVVAHTGTFKPETLSGVIRWMRASTVYEAVGDWPWYAAAAAAFVLSFVRRKALAA